MSLSSSPEWLWAIKQHEGQHSDRSSCLRSIAYIQISADPSCTKQEGDGAVGLALSLNISPKGLLILMDREPVIDQVMRISVPSPAPGVSIPTMADVRWTRKVPLMSGKTRPIFFVGLRFLL
jgi:hypothetical protein